MAAAYFQAAAWNQGLFDAFVACSTLLVIAVWVILYGKARGVRILLPAWLERLHTRLYVAFLSALYIEDIVRALRPGRATPRARQSSHS